MPYYSVEDLPPTIQNTLPYKAQEIYRKAFNKMWDYHRDPKTLPHHISRVEVAAIIAWTAVKKEYHKRNGLWVKRKHASYSVRVKSRVLKELQSIPGIGKNTAHDLWDLEIRSKKELKNRNPERLFKQLEELRGKPLDRRILYRFRCAIYYLTHKRPNKAYLTWQAWKD